MLRILKNIKGSALTYVLIIMMLLSILGLSLISSTVINFKINRQSNSFNKSFYITDGAIDETLAELREITFRAEADASDWINDLDADFREENKWVVFFNKVNTRLESGELTSEQVVEQTQTALEREFTKRYYQFLLEVPGVSSDDAKEIYELDYVLYDNDGNFVETNNIKLKSIVVLKPEYHTDLTEVSFAPADADNFKSASIENITLTQEINDDYFSLNIESNGAYNNNRKVIEVKLDVIIPNYNYIVSTESKNLEINKNEALANAVMARGDIIIVDGKVRVNGDIYAYGTLPNRQEYLYSDVGGILVGVDRTNLNSLFTSTPTFTPSIDLDNLISNSIKGELEVDGDVQTRSSIRINGDHSTINSTGDMYANSFIVDKDADDFIGSIDKNLYIMEDMILFGDNSDISIGKTDDLTDDLIDGELWTFLEGSPSGTNRGVRDLSGSIIVNSNSDSLKLTANKYFISGVAYIDIYRTLTDGNGDYRAYYQSGESFTTNNSNNFYTKKIASVDKSASFVKYTVASGPNVDEEVEVVETTSVSATSGEVTILNDVNYKAIHLITKNNEIIDGTETGLGEISIRDKKLFTINSLKTKESKNKYKNYALGVVLANEKIFNPYSMTASDAATFVNMPFNDFIESRKKNVEKLDAKVSLLATRNYTNGTNEDEKFDEIFAVEGGDNNVSNITDANNFIFINDDVTKNIYINVPATLKSSLNDDDAVFVVHDSANMTLTGAIITKGNIIIYNTGTIDFVFNGVLISEKNILMYGDGQKIINSKSTADSYSAELIRAIATNEKLFKATNSDGGKKVEVASVPGGSHLTRSIDGNLEINIIDNSETINPTINSNVLLEGIIKTSKAKTIHINSWKEID